MAQQDHLHFEEWDNKLVLNVGKNLSVDKAPYPDRL